MSAIETSRMGHVTHAGKIDIIPQEISKELNKSFENVRSLDLVKKPFDIKDKAFASRGDLLPTEKDALKQSLVEGWEKLRELISLSEEKQFVVNDPVGDYKRLNIAHSSAYIEIYPEGFFELIVPKSDFMEKEKREISFTFLSRKNTPNKLDTVVIADKGQNKELDVNDRCLVGNFQA
jgi:hypothetical protein